MTGLFLPKTDVVIGVQLLLTFLVGAPVVFVLYRRRAAIEFIWFAGGIVTLLLGLFAIRTVR